VTVAASLPLGWGSKSLADEDRRLGRALARRTLIPPSDGAERPQSVGLAPHFSASQQAWIVHRPEDIRAVLRDGRFGQLGAPVRGEASNADASNQPALAEQPQRWWISPESAALLRPDARSMEGFVRQLRHLISIQTDRTPPNVPTTVDLMATIIRPWCHHVTAVLLDLPIAVVNEAEPLTRQVFESAALVMPAEDAVSSVSDAAGATQALSDRLAPYRSAQRPGDGLDIQAWVALTQSLPALIGAGARRLVAPDTTNTCPFAGSETGMARAINDALLAAASPVRALFRTALQPATIADTVIVPGDRVMLMVEGHAELVFGDGPHRCAGATLVRALFGAALRVLGDAPITGLADPAPGRAVWVDGAALRVLRSLSVEMHRPL